MSRDDKRRRKRRQRTEGDPKSVWIMMSAAVVLGVVIIAMVAQLVRLNRQGEHLPLTAITVEECADALYRRFGAEGK